MGKFLPFLVTCGLLLSLSACSAKSVQAEEKTVQTTKQESQEESLDSFAEEMEVQEVYDPFASYNRMMTRFNDGAYEYVLKPVATGYKSVVHFEIRNSIENFFDNIYFPIRFVNTLLQGKFTYAFEETERFVINTTVGVLGLFDPAQSYFKIEAHKEDFGQTLGFYGVGGGPHIVLPLLGPSNLRDTLSLYPDSFLSVIDYEERSYWTLTDTPAEYIGAKTLEKINFISLYMHQYDKMKEDAVDLYPYLRDIYEQRRKREIEE